MSTPRDRAATRAAARPRSLTSLAWQLRPTKWARAVLHTPVRLINAGQDLVHATEQLPALVARIRAFVEAADALLDRVGVITSRADAAVSDVEVTRSDAHAVVQAARQTEQRLRTLLTQLQPLLAAAADIDPASVREIDDLVQRLRPTLRACADPDAAFASQAAQLLARTGPLLDQVDAVVMPLLKEMRGAVPDVRDILPVVQRLEPVMVDVETRIAGLPGAARLRKRGEREITDA